MPRVARIVIPGLPHHVTQRGNHRAVVYHDTADYHAYLAMLHQYISQFPLDILAYCLMPNHSHLIVVPHDAETLSSCIRAAHTKYALRYNLRYQLTGHLWQGRFASCVLDESHMWNAIRYVERNPVRAGMVRYAEDYPWSSARGHCGLNQDPLLSPSFPPPGAIEDWQVWLRTEDEELSNYIRHQTITGRPCGTKEFIKQLEDTMHKALGPQRPGRKHRSCWD